MTPSSTRCRWCCPRSSGSSRPSSPLLDEAVLAAGGRPRGSARRSRCRCSSRSAPTAAAARVLRGLLEVIEANLEGTIADIDSEFLHD